MAELLHADVIQQLEVILLGSPAAQILDLLAAGVMQLASTSKGNVILPPKAYTSTLMAPPLPTAPIIGITSSLPVQLCLLVVVKQQHQSLTRFQNVAVLLKLQSSHANHLYYLAVSPLPVHPTNQPHTLI